MRTLEPWELQDSYLSWRLAIEELRKRGLREGRFAPETDEEREYVRRCGGEGKAAA